MREMAGNDHSESENQPTEHCLDALLSRFYDLGESVSVKKNQKHAAESSVSKDEPKVTGLGAASREKATSYKPTTTCKKKHSSHDFFETLKEELHNQSSDAKCTRTAVERDVSSTAEMSEKGACVEVVRFLSQKEKKKAKLEAAQEPKSKPKVKTQEKDNKEHTFSFEKARLEVHRFGITGYKKEKQRTFEQERAIMLGAKPPKKEYLNYKVYQDQVKLTRATKKEESVKESDPSKRKRKRGQEERWSKKKRSASTVLPSGQVGKFKNGTLLLSGKDIKKIKTSKVVK